MKFSGNPLYSECRTVHASRYSRQTLVARIRETCCNSVETTVLPVQRSFHWRDWLLNVELFLSSNAPV